jgi:hypothetical protein
MSSASPPITDIRQGIWKPYLCTLTIPACITICATGLVDPAVSGSSAPRPIRSRGDGGGSVKVGQFLPSPLASFRNASPSASNLLIRPGSASWVRLRDVALIAAAFSAQLPLYLDEWISEGGF